MRLDRRPRQVVLRDHDARGPALGAGERLEWELPRGRRAQIDSAQEFGLLPLGLLPLLAALLERALGQTSLGVQRRALVGIGGHALEDLHESGRIVRRPYDTLQGV